MNNKLTTMKRLFTTTLVAGLSLAFVLPSCVSSKKYKTSQSSLQTSQQTVQQLREDSTKLANETAALKDKVSGLETTNASQKTSIDSMNTYISQQKPNMDYQAYFVSRQEAGTQLQQTLTTDLAASGLTIEEIEHQNGIVSVSLDEKKFFSPGSANLNSNGKKIINQIASSAKAKPDFVVGVMPAEMGMPAPAETQVSDNSSTADNSTANAEMKEGSSKSSTAGKSTSAKKSSTAKHSSASSKKHYSSESGKTVSNKAKPRKSAGSSMALRSARATTVAKSLLTEGVSEVRVTLKKDNVKKSGDQKDAIKVVLSPDHSKMTEQPKETASASKE